MKLGDFVISDAIVPELQGAERDDVIRELVDALAAAGVITKSFRQELVDHIIEREKGGSTGFGKGVAVPHVKHEKIKKMAAAIGVSPTGIDFSALDRAPVYTVVLLLSPANKPDEHLQAMENIFTNLQNDKFRRFLRQATTVEAVQDVIQEADTQRLHG